MLQQIWVQRYSKGPKQQQNLWGVNVTPKPMGAGTPKNPASGDAPALSSAVPVHPQNWRDLSEDLSPLSQPQTAPHSPKLHPTADARSLFPTGTQAPQISRASSPGTDPPPQPPSTRGRSRASVSPPALQAGFTPSPPSKEGKHYLGSNITAMGPILSWDGHSRVLTPHPASFSPLVMLRDIFPAGSAS